MSDVVDRANDLADMHRDQALKKIPSYQGVSAIHCADCDEPIPQARRLALPGVELCVVCQEITEAGFHGRF